MENRFLAKSNPMETIQEHTDLLEENARILKEYYPCIHVDWEILRLAVLFHDLGKMNTKFQDKLYKKLKLPLLDDDIEGDDIPHGNLSAAFLDWKKLKEHFNEDSIRVLFQAVYYHHPRFIPKEKRQYIQQVIEHDLTRYSSIYNGSISQNPFYRSIPRPDFSRYTAERIDYPHDPSLFYSYIMVKGLLNRLDYAASAHIDVEIPNTDLREKTHSFLIEKGGLRPIQSYLLEHTEENNVIVASTGIGKTEAGLLWIGNAKGFFTLPLRVSINAIYERIQKKDIRFENTALLHSDALAFLVMKTDSTDYLIHYEQARQLSMPLTITTVDQLFKVVFKQEGFEAILATLSYSKVIIDEIQVYSPEIVACILMGLKYITDIGGKFTILTATFPQVLESFMKELSIPYNYNEYLLEKKRHRIRIRDEEIDTAIDEIIEKGKTSKVLVIVNTVKKAQELYRLLGDIPGKYLLHSRFIRRDRRRLEREIMEFSNTPGSGIWVTTQVVEASLDIDFDYLFTQLSTVDGLFQRMGRCFRKRELFDDRFNINVFTKNPSGLGKVFDTELFELSLEALIPFDRKEMTETEKLEVVKSVYSLEKIKPTTYYKTIRERLQFLQEIPAYEFSRDEVEEKFRNIQSYTVIPIEVYNDNSNEIHRRIEEMSQLGFSDQEKAERIRLLEWIKDLTVDVPAYMMEKGKEKKIEVDSKNMFNLISREYDRFIGLCDGKGLSGR